MPPPDPTNEKPGAVATADRAGIDTPGEMPGHSMSSAGVASSLVARWRLLGEVKRNRALSGTDWSVLVAVLDRMGQNATSWPGLSKISTDIDADRSSVVRSIKRLCEFGYLVRESGNARKSNTYSIGLSRCESAPRCEVAPSSESAPNLGANLRLGVGANLSLEVGANLHPESALRESVSVEPKKEPVKKLSSASRPEEQKGIEDSFVRFWKAYPRKDAKPDAEKAWRQVKGAEHIDAILADIAKRTADPQQWTERQFTPMPATYLRKKRWLDEWQPDTLMDRVRRAAEEFGEYDFSGKAPTVDPAYAAKLRERNARTLGVAASFEGKTYTGSTDEELDAVFGTGWRDTP